ncbi:MAG: MGMT family protein [Balneolaceae bacterium]|nr:MGMT family protein [Balneolaceae bacterium]MBO6547449.1 MGMT family protein [Balneolaceae bacterium]MBO6647604.1 MGMT family protein [Balneolaceae bacterium]
MNKKKPNDFYQRVYEVVAQIPNGKVTSYGAISKYLGVESGARMVGYAMNNYVSTELGFEIPAHRVLNRLGQLTGRAHFEGDTMRERLEQEGVEFKEEYTVNMDKHFWNPFELELL